MINKYAPGDLVFEGNPWDKYDSEATPVAGAGGPAAVGTPKPADRTARQAVIRAMTNTQLQVALRMGQITGEEVSEVFGPNKMAELAIDPWGSSENQLLAQWSTTPPEIPAAPTATPAPVTPPPTGSIAGTVANQIASGQPPDVSALTQVPALDTSSGIGGAGNFPTLPSRTSAGSGAAAPKLPPLPLRDSALDLRNRGALNVAGTPVLEGQQYARLNEVMQATDGQWYIVDPSGQPVSGPFPNQTQASAANVYSDLGPAVTTNASAALGQAALMGAARPRVSAGSGQDARASIDQIIAATHARSTPQAADFMGAAQTQYGPVDILRAAIPDYGGMRGVNDATGDATGYTGRINGPDGEIGIGTGAINQVGTQYGSQIQSVLAPYLSQSQINRIDPAKYDQIALAVNALREAGQLQQADTAATKGLQAGNYTALTGDVYGVDTLPETFAEGGEMNFDWTPQAPIDPMTGQPYPPGWAPEWLEYIKQQVNGSAIDPAFQQRLQDSYWWGRYAQPMQQMWDAGVPTMAEGGSMTVNEPSVIQGLLSGKPYGVMGAGAGERVSNITPLGNRQQQAQAQSQEQAIAQLLSTPGRQGSPMGWSGDVLGRDPWMREQPFIGVPPGEGPESGGTPGRVLPRPDRNQMLLNRMLDMNHNGIDDREEEWTEPDGRKYRRKTHHAPAPPAPQATQPTPNVFAGGGSINTNMSHDPMVLEMMARGIRRRARGMLPKGVI